MALRATSVVFGPLRRQKQPVIEQGVAVPADIAEEDADLAVVDLAEPAAPLPLDATGVLALLGEAGAVTDENALGIPPDLDDMLPQTVQHRPVLPGGGADEVLQVLAANVGEVGDGLAGLAGEVGEFALEDELSVEALLAALALIPSLMPSMIGHRGPVYSVLAGILSSLLLYYSARLAFQRSVLAARRLLLASIVYLPLAFCLLMFGK